MLDTFAISAQALTSQRIRLNVIASNLANMNTTRTPDGTPYRRKDVVFSSQPFHNAMEVMGTGTLTGVRVVDVVEDPRPFRAVYEPSHPDANRDGYVMYPNINPVEEMVNMMTAIRSYEANVTALKATKTMIAKALEIIS